jgi:hypothetical protein
MNRKRQIVHILATRYNFISSVPLRLFSINPHCLIHSCIWYIAWNGCIVAVALFIKMISHDLSRGTEGNCDNQSPKRCLTWSLLENTVRVLGATFSVRSVLRHMVCMRGDPGLNLPRFIPPGYSWCCLLPIDEGKKIRLAVIWYYCIAIWFLSAQTGPKLTSACAINSGQYDVKSPFDNLGHPSFVFNKLIWILCTVHQWKMVEWVDIAVCVKFRYFFTTSYAFFITNRNIFLWTYLRYR